MYYCRSTEIQLNVDLKKIENRVSNDGHKHYKHLDQAK